MSAFAIEGPAVVSFSGGRTSAYMFWRILADGIEPDVHVVFANTGKESPETLDFVDECARRWGVKIRWLEYRRTVLPEYRSDERREAAAMARAARSSEYVPVDGEPGFVEVDYESASRRGEPFENLIDMMGLPNVTTRMCTQEMKIRVIKRFMLSLGYSEWTNVVGIRADEPKRVARMRNADADQRWENSLPLADEGIVKDDVLRFWRVQPFDLRLGIDENGETYAGNCDLCHLKSTGKRVRVAREKPEALAWWERQEEITGQRFRDHGDTYARLRLRAFGPDGAVPACAVDDDLGDCICHD